MSPSIVPDKDVFPPKHKNANWTISCNGDHTGCYPFLRKTIISQHTWAHFSWGCCCQKQPRPHGKDLILSRCYTFIHFTGMKKWFKCFKTIACSIELLFYLGKSVWYFKNTLMCKWLIRLGHSLSNIYRSEWYMRRKFYFTKSVITVPTKRKAWWHV